MFSASISDTLVRLDTDSPNKGGGGGGDGGGGGGAPDKCGGDPFTRVHHTSWQAPHTVVAALRNRKNELHLLFYYLALFETILFLWMNRKTSLVPKVTRI